MRIDGVAFESPAGLEDSTNYRYRARGGSEEFTAEFELPVGAAVAADEVVTEVREGLEGFYGAALTIEADGAAMLAGAPGRAIHFSLTGTDGSGTPESRTSKIVVANPGAPAGGAAHGDWVKLSWTDDCDPAALAARFDPILASFRAASETRDPAAPGHTRHPLGAWVIDLPDHLAGPRTFIFEDVDAELRIELSVLEAGADEPELAAGVATARGVEVDRQIQTLPDGQRLDLRVRSDDDPNGESTLILAKRVVALGGARAGDQRWVVLSASGPSVAGARLTALVDALLASVRADDAREPLTKT